MSQENVEMVRSIIDALNRRDLEAAFKHVAPDFEFDFSRAVGLQRGAYKRDQMGGFFEQFVEPWEGVRWEVGEFVEAGDHIVALVTTYFRGRQGIEVEASAFWVGTIRDGAVAHLCWYGKEERKEALEAAGLSE